MMFRRKPRTTSLSPTSSWKRPSSTRRPLGRTRAPSSAKVTPSSDRRKKLSRGSFTGFFKKLKIILAVGTLGGIASWVLYFLFLSGQLTLTHIEVQQDSEVIPNETLEQLFKKFEGENLLLLKTEDFEPYLRQRYTEYETIQVVKDFPNTLRIVLTTYPPVANLIVAQPNEEETFFLLNSSGHAIGGKEKAEFPTVKIEPSEALEEGDTVLTQERLAFVLESIQNFEDKFGMQIIHALYFDNAREVHLLTERNFYVWLDITSDLDEQLNKLKKALSKLDIYNENLEYIDLRITGINGEKVIFKRATL